MATITGLAKITISYQADTTQTYDVVNGYTFSPLTQPEPPRYQLPGVAVERKIDIPDLVRRERPLYVPGYFSGHVPIHDDGFVGDEWRKAYREALVPWGAAGPYAASHVVTHPWAGNPQFFPFHLDGPGPFVRSVLCVRGRGRLSFLNRGYAHPGQIDYIPDEGELLTFPLEVGDALFWTTRTEEAGWQHGGRTGTRTSLVLRFDLPPGVR